MPKTVKANETERAVQEIMTAKEKDTGDPERKAAYTYTVEELIAASETALHVPRECAAAAFKIQGKKNLSLSEAKSIVEKFMKGEVK